MVFSTLFGGKRVVKNRSALPWRYCTSSFNIWNILLLLVAGYCPAQKSSYAIAHYNNENGLPQNSVKSINFDKAGYCWLATEMGLVRFDGKRFNTYGISEIPGITSDRIKMQASDLSGDLYALTAKNERVIINSGGHRRGTYPELIVDKNIYLPTIGYVGAKTHVDSLNALFFQKHKRPQGSEGGSPGTGEVYLSALEDLYYITKKRVIQLGDRDLDIANRQKSIIGSYYVHLYPGNRINVWKSGVLIPSIDKISGPIEQDPDYLSGKSKVLWCKEGTYVYSGKTLYRIDLNQNRIISEKVLENLDIINLTCMYYVRDQNKYYFGSETEGLYIVETGSFEYPTVPAEASSESFYPQSRTIDGRIFTGDVLFSRDKSSKYIPLHSKDGATHFITDDNQLYFDSDFKFYRHDLNTGKTHSLIALDRRLRSVFPNGKDLIFCTRRSIGILSNDVLKMQQEFPNSLEIITALRLDKNNFLLASESGLKWYNMPQNKVYKSILDSLQIRTVHQDGGRLWIASYGKGFYLYEKGKIYAMPLGPQKSLKAVHAFIDDGAGSFWLPTNNGLFKVLKSELAAFAHGKSEHVYFYMMTKQNGLRTNEFNGGCDPAYLRMQDGMLSLPSMNGLVWFYPNKMSLVYPDKKIYIDGLSVNNKPIDITSQKAILDPNFSELTMKVSSPFFGNPQNMQFEYQIAGLSETWNAVPENGEIRLSRTPPGNYKIVVRSASGKAANAYETLELAFEVTPWFYNTWWFYLISLFAMASIVYLLIRRRLNAIKEKSKQLKVLVDVRTHELSAAVQELAESESALLRSNQVKDKVITMVLHDLRSPISFLNTISNYLVASHQDIEQKELNQKLIELQHGTRGLRLFTENFFTWAASQHEDFKVTIKTVHIQDLFNEIDALYTDIVKSRKNQLLIAPTKLICQTDYQILALIIRNLIDNANKHTRDGKIFLGAAADERATIISVSDTGPGLDDAQLKNYTNESRGLGNQGIGSVLILKMLQEINGKLDIKTSRNGSSFSVTLNHHPENDTGGQAG
ncbi:ATP-binding protein [Dyadobacter sp. LHD-138]|uniref:sensor histidine kinase n=1 Tax=Dyadobacter sp. LHD-138 TaxID=3071413 RepID=UPI0027E0F782|nr:ATP-binding protein [Dyadobacter sp. LHD-138]MDQ6480632.1 ATP-binding protein [Dyadobacter sp. LHD-138]